MRTKVAEREDGRDRRCALCCLSRLLEHKLRAIERTNERADQTRTSRAVEAEEGDLGAELEFAALEHY